MSIPQESEIAVLAGALSAVRNGELEKAESLLKQRLAHLQMQEKQQAEGSDAAVSDPTSAGSATSGLAYGQVSRRNQVKQLSS
jgi:hypothetical protein